MKFNHLVKHNGVYYPIGADVPINEANGGGKEAPAVDVSGKVEVKEDAPVITDEPRQAHKYTEEELDVPYFSLKSLAKKEGLKIPDKAKAGEIKDMLRAL